MSNITLNAAPNLTGVTYYVEQPSGTFSAAYTDAVEVVIGGVHTGTYQAPEPSAYVGIQWSDGQVFRYAGNDVVPLAAAVLATPANKLATDSNGKVGANNLPSDYQQRGMAVALPNLPSVTVGGYTLGQDPASLVLDAPFLSIPGSHTTTGTAQTLTLRQALALMQATLSGDDTPSVPIAGGTATVTYYLPGQPQTAANIVAVSTVTYDANKQQTGRTLKFAQPFPAVQ